MLGAEPPARLPEGLSPGDFATVRRKASMMGETNVSTLVGWLEEEADAKHHGRSRPIGFRASPAPGVALASVPLG